MTKLPCASNTGDLWLMGSSLRRLNLLILALHAAAMKSLMIVHALRLMPGDDLVESILDYCQTHALGARLCLRIGSGARPIPGRTSA